MTLPSGTVGLIAPGTSTTYILNCTGPGGSASQSTTVTVTLPAPNVSISATSSTIRATTATTLVWSSGNATACAASGAWSGSQALNGSMSTGKLTASQTYTLTCTGPGGSAKQSTTVTVSATAPTVTFSAGPSSIASGSSSTLTWSATNATSCTAGNGWSGTRAVSGSASTGALAASTTYRLACTGAGGITAQSATVSVTTTAPTVTLTASPSSVTRGHAAALSWSSSNATACTATNGWSGSRVRNGSVSTGPVIANTTYTLTCTGAGGSASQSTIVSAFQPAPVVMISATPNSVGSGNSSTLSWSATNATSCTASGGWSGSVATSGTRATGPLSATTQFVLACAGPGGTASSSATVSVTTTPPTISTFSASPGSVPRNGESTLSWVSVGATGCSVSGALTGTLATSGSLLVTGIQSTSTYTLTCINSAGAATLSTTVVVVPTISGSPAATATVGTGYSFTPTATSGAGTTRTFNIRNLPGWARFNPATGQVSGTPIANGTFGNIIIGVSDGTLSTLLAAFTITVSETDGRLSITSPATLAGAMVGATAGSAYSYTMSASGGTPPYTWSFNRLRPLTMAFSTVNEWNISQDGIVSNIVSPTARETATLVIQVRDSAGNSTTGNFNIPVTGMQITTPMSLGNVASGTAYSSASPLALMAANGGVGPYSWSLASQSGGSNSWSVTCDGAVIGTPVSNETDSLVITATDTGTGRTVSNTYYVTVYPAVSGVARPAYNTGNGFFVLNGELYDANGSVFRIRGVDQAHYDSDPQPGLSLTRANAVRMFMWLTDGSISAATYVNTAKTQHIDYGEVPVITMSVFPDGTTSSCNSSTAQLQSGVAWWTANVAAFNTISRYMYINIANEWGPANSAAWQSAYQAVIGNITAISGNTVTVNSGAATNPFAGQTQAYIGGAGGIAGQTVSISGTGGSPGAWTITTGTSFSGYSGGGRIGAGAIGQMRVAGYTIPLLIDTGNCGQDRNELPDFAAGIFNSDPQKNIRFAFHFYGLGYGAPWSTIAQMDEVFRTLQSLKYSTGASFAVTEFGPGYGIGPSPTSISPAQVVTTAEKYGLSWSAWAWDDNTMMNSQAQNDWFDFQYQNGVYLTQTDLTIYGQDMVLNPYYGVRANAKPASVF